METLEAYKEDQYCILCLSTFRYRSPAAYKEAVLCLLDHLKTCCDPPHLVGHLPDPQRMLQGMDLICSQYYGMYSMVRISCVSRYKKLFTHTESHASAMRLLESGEQRNIKANKQQILWPRCVHHGTDLICGKYYGYTPWYGSHVWQILWYVHRGRDLMCDNYCDMYIMVRILCAANTLVCTSWYGSHVR